MFRHHLLSPSVIVFTTLGIVFWGATARSQSGPPGEAQSFGGEVHGTVLAELQDGAGLSRCVPLPNIRVFLEDLDKEIIVSSTFTDAHGRYYFRRRPQGHYKVTWEAPGWETAPEDPEAPKSPELKKFEFDLGTGTEHLDQIVVRPVRDKVVVRGKVRLKDGESPYLEATKYGLRQTAEVEARDSSKDHKTEINAEGDYILPGLSSKPRSLRARIVRTGTLPFTGEWEGQITPDDRERIAGRDRYAGAVEAPGSEDRRGDRVAGRGRYAKAVEAPASRSGDRRRVGDVVSLNLELPSESLDDFIVTADGVGPDGKAAPGATIPLQVDKPSHRGQGLDCLWKVDGSETVGRDEKFRWKLADYKGEQTIHYLLLERHGGFAERAITLSTLRP